jgi:hypothetical protein
MRDHLGSNYAQDVVINESIIKYLKLDRLNIGIYLNTIEAKIGKKYGGEMIFEEIYEFIEQDGLH